MSGQEATRAVDSIQHGIVHYAYQICYEKLMPEAIHIAKST